MKNKKRSNSPADGLLGLLFPGVLLLFLAVNLLVPDRTMSEKENRELASRPGITLSNMTGGAFMEEYENYASDQFAGRDIWRSIKVSLSRLGGSRMENGVYIGKTGSFLRISRFPIRVRCLKILKL